VPPHTLRLGPLSLQPGQVSAAGHGEATPLWVSDFAA
jgi:hypothetical protein